MDDIPLEPDLPGMRRMGLDAIELVSGAIAKLDEARASTFDDDQKLCELARRAPAERGHDFAEALELFATAAADGIETAGPHYFGYIPSGGLYTSAIADLLSGALIRSTGLSGLSPALVAMEDGVIAWLCERFGLPETAGGVLTSGGSMAHLAAVVAARTERLGEDFADGTLYTTSEAHYSVAKAARIAGLPARAVRIVPTGADLRMDIGVAARMIADDRREGARPFLLVDNTERLLAAHSATGEYLRDLHPTSLPHYANYGPELTRDFRGLRLWLPLWVHGVTAFRTALDEKLDLARAAHNAMRQDPRFETPLRPDLSVVVFRAKGLDDVGNRALLERVNATGRIYLSSTMINGRYVLRLCVLSHRTHADHLAEALAVLGEHVDGLSVRPGTQLSPGGLFTSRSSEGGPEVRPSDRWRSQRSARRLHR